MVAVATELETLIDTYLSKLIAISDNDLLYKPLPNKWSKKELIGHLIDSAQNNTRRFIIAQSEEKPAIA